MTTRLTKLRLNRIDLVDRGANPGAHVTLCKRDATPAPAGEEPMAEDTAAVEELQKRLDDLEKAAKDADARAKAAEDVVAKVQDERAREHAIRKAAEWKDLGAADDLGGLLYECRKSLTPDAMAKLEVQMAAWNEQISKGKLFATIGKQTEDETDPNVKLEKLAKAYAGQHGVSYEQAYAAVAVSAEGRGLYAEIRGRK